MSETREQTKRQLRLILSMAFSLDAAMEEFMRGVTMEDDEGDAVLRDEHDMVAWLAIGGFRHRLGELTCGLHRIILNRYERSQEDGNEQGDTLEGCHQRMAPTHEMAPDTDTK